MKDIKEKDFMDDDIKIEFINFLCVDSKNFGKEELDTEEKIIRKNSIPVKSNFFEYYEQELLVFDQTLIYIDTDTKN